jgi:hypothetical protein
MQAIDQQRALQVSHFQTPQPPMGQQAAGPGAAMQ